MIHVRETLKTGQLRRRNSQKGFGGFSVNRDTKLRTEAHEGQQDVFLSHRSADKLFVRKLAADIEATPCGDRYLTAWLDEAEIRPGQSVPGMVNHGLEWSHLEGRKTFVQSVLAVHDLSTSPWIYFLDLFP